MYKFFNRWLFKIFVKYFISRDLCIISQNCLGGKFYQLQNRQYTSPTIGLWFRSDEFIKFCLNLEYYLGNELIYCEDESIVYKYPVAKLADVTIYFQHYKDFDSARDKWLNRLSRINMNNLVVFMTDRDNFKIHDLESFDSIKLRKILFTSKKQISHKPYVILISAFDSLDYVGDLYGNYHHLLRYSLKIFNLLKGK